MSSKGKVASVNISKEKGTIKQAAAEIVVDERGIKGDAHAGLWHRQLSLLAGESVERFAREIGRAIKPGEFAENVTTLEIDLGKVALLDRLIVGEAELEVTQIGKECHGDECAIFREVGKCVMPKEGIFCRVLKGGVIKAGDKAAHEARPLRFHIATLSDRAHAGAYEDKSGPKVKDTLEAFLEGKRWHPEISTALLPDDRDELLKELESARRNSVDVFITTGGTGVGPRDIAPEVVSAFCDKLIPGIMEAIRVRYGLEKPNALLSRSVAGVAGTMLVYALPGSVRAAAEYMSEILKTMEHLILMIHGIDAH